MLYSRSLLIVSFIRVCVCAKSLSRVRPFRLLWPWDSLGKNTGVGCMPSLQENLPNPGIKPRSPALAGRFLPLVPPGNPYFLHKSVYVLGFAQLVKNLPTMQETWIRSMGWEGPPGEGKGYPLQYSALESFMDCIVHGVTKSRTRLSAFHFHFHVCVNPSL